MENACGDSPKTQPQRAMANPETVLESRKSARRT